VAEQFTDYTSWFATRGARAAAGFFLPHLKPGMRLLDCGSGPGTITLDFAEMLAPQVVTGVDWDNYRVGLSITAAKQRGIRNVQFEVADIHHLPFPDASFDAVWCASCLQWVEDKKAAVAEIHRVLKPGGVFAARDRNVDGDIFGNPNPLLRRAWKLHYRFQEGDWGDVRFGGKLRDAFLSAGFENVISTSSYENHGDPDGARWAAGFFCAYLGEQWAVDEIAKLGWESRETIQSMVAAWKQWGEDSLSYYCLARGEAVGWKPKA
jgi:SAM-dependent methyltransferase